MSRYNKTSWIKSGRCYIFIDTNVNSIWLDCVCSKEFQGRTLNYVAFRGAFNRVQ